MAFTFGTPSSAASKPAGSLFGSTTSTTPATGTLFGSTATSTPGGLFGAATATSTPAAGTLFSSATTSTPAAGTLFGSTPASSAPASGSLFGGTPATTAATGTGGLFGSPAPNTSIPMPRMSSYGGMYKPPTTATVVTTTAPGQGLFGTNIAGSVAVAQTGTAPNVSIDPNAPVNMKTFEEAIDALALETDRSVQLFRRQLTEANAYDSVLQKNSDKITELNNELCVLEEQTQKEAHDIAFVNDQLAALEKGIVDLEKQYELPPWTESAASAVTLANSGGRGGETHADRIRQYTFDLLMSTDAQLKQTEDDLRDAAKMTEDLVAARAPPSADLSSLKKVLEKQMLLLNWLAETSGEVRSKTQAIQL